MKENYGIKGHVILQDEDGNILVDKDNMILTTGRTEIFNGNIKAFTDGEVLLGYDINGMLVNSSDGTNDPGSNTNSIKPLFKYSSKTSSPGESTKFKLRDDNKLIIDSSGNYSGKYYKNKNSFTDYNVYGFIGEVNGNLYEEIEKTELYISNGFLYSKEPLTITNENLEIKYSYVFKNDSNTDIQISTLGIGTLGIADGDTFANTLLTRVTFLPVTLSKDSSYTLTYTLYF